MIKKLIIAIFLILVLFVYGCTSGSSRPGPNIQGQAVHGSDLQQDDGAKVGTNKGDRAPDFSITTIDGKSLSLSGLTNDKPTVLYFYATWCPNCARDLAAVKDVYPEFADKVNFLAIDIDPKESESKIAEYQQRMNLPGIDFAASDRNVLASYNVVYTTTKYFIGKDGIILNKGVGGIDANTWRQIFQSLAQ